MRAWLLALVAAAVGVACASPEAKLRARAAADLRCPQGELALESRKTAADLPGEMRTTWDVSGCGRSGAYRYSSVTEEWAPEPASP